MFIKRIWDARKTHCIFAQVKGMYIDPTKLHFTATNFPQNIFTNGHEYPLKLAICAVRCMCIRSISILAVCKVPSISFDRALSESIKPFLAARSADKERSCAFNFFSSRIKSQFLSMCTCMVSLCAAAAVSVLIWWAVFAPKYARKSRKSSPNPSDCSRQFPHSAHISRRPWWDAYILWLHMLRDRIYIEFQSEWRLFLTHFGSVASRPVYKKHSFCVQNTNGFHHACQPW